jgi:hypothetical protein
MPHRFHLARATLVVAALGLAVPSVALADGGPEFVVGPVKVKHGYTASANGFSCGTKYAGGTVSFDKSGTGWTEDHSYGGANDATCQIAGNLASGTLKFKFRDVTVNIKFRKKGRAKTGPLPPGCHGAKPKTQPGIATGTIRISISKGFFGSVKLGKAKASVTKTTYTCTEPRSFKRTTFLTAFSGGEADFTSLSAVQPPKGPRSVGIFKSIAGASMSSSHSITLTGGPSLFSAKNDLSSAKVSANGKIKGNLKFKAKPSCKGNNREGTLIGSLTAHFDVIGRVTVKQNKSSPATLSRNANSAPCS